MRRFTLHVRLTKRCNADCAYCSSFAAAPGSRMAADHFRAAVSWLSDELLPSLGVGGAGAHLSIEYVGGEILTLPAAELRGHVMFARERFSSLFGTVRDGVQSNLISTPEKVAELDALFGGRVGTSVDRLGDQRTVAGSADRYREIRARSVARIERRRRRPPGAIFVVDGPGLGHVLHEIDGADADNHSLVLRPVFDGGKQVDKADIAACVSVMGEGFDRWAMRSRVPVEPFYHLTASRLSVLRSGAVDGAIASCPFQRNCAEVSMDLEANGDLYVCLDMADSGQARLGNALSREFDRDLWETLRARKDHVDPKCRSCPWFASCQGGCMSQAIQDTGSVYGRPDLCALWTAIFGRVDALVADRGAEAVGEWLGGLA